MAGEKTSRENLLLQTYVFLKELLIVVANLCFLKEKNLLQTLRLLFLVAFHAYVLLS
jgi:hypothetical protein